MSLIKLAGNASGTGTLTIQAPNTNTNYTLDLPAAAGTIQLSGNAISGTTGTFSGTISGGSTIGVGGATPANTGAGITFPATQSASSDANTLDDYEEGTWTPIMLASGSNPTVTYSLQNGLYVKVGQLVYAAFYLGISSISGGTGLLRIGGLPFTSTNLSEADRACLTVGYVTGFSSSTTPTAGLINSNSTLITLYTTSSADARDAKNTTIASPPAGNPNLYGTVVYRAA